jgi:ABC-type multidrug transport system permease subunit
MLIVIVFLVPVFWQLNDYDGTNPGPKIQRDYDPYDPTDASQIFSIEQQNEESMVGAMYFLCVMQMFLNFLPTVIVFQGEKPIFVRERASNMYDIWVYATTKMFAEIPIMLLTPAILVLAIYFTIGFVDSAAAFFQFYLIIALMVQAATAMGYFLSSAFNSETAAVAFAPIINMPLTLLGGYMINLNSIKGQYPQVIVEWVQYLSPVRYCFNGLMQAQWKTYCTTTTDPSAFACVDSNDPNVVAILNYYGTDISFWGCAGGLFALWLGMRGCTVISLVLQDAQCQCGTDQNDTRNQKLAVE